MNHLEEHRAAKPQLKVRGYADISRKEAKTQSLLTLFLFGSSGLERPVQRSRAKLGSGRELYNFVSLALFVVKKAASAYNRSYRLFRTMTKPCLFRVALLNLPFSLQALTITADSPPLGGIELTAEAYRETPFGIPLHRPAVAIAYLAEVLPPDTDAQSNFESLRLVLDQVIGAPGTYDPDSNTNLPAYYLEVVTGAAAGERFSIAASGEDWIVIEQEPQGTLAASFDPTALRDQIRIRPCWTPGTFMPAASAPLTAQVELATLVETRDSDALILHDRQYVAEAGVRRFIQRFEDSAGSTYWAEWTGMSERSLADDYGILPGQVNWVRRASAENATWVLTGDVTTFNPAWPIPSPTAGSVLEWPFSLTELVSVTLDTSGLSEVLRASSSAAERQDELIVWENQTGFYTRPARRFYLQSTGSDPIWREIGDTVTDQGTYPLEPGKAYTIRRRGE